MLRSVRSSLERFLCRALFASVLLFSCPFSTGLLFSGEIDSTECFQYVERYVVPKVTTLETAYVRLNISFSGNTSTLAWVLYNQNAWGNVVDPTVSCHDKVKHAMKYTTYIPIAPEEIFVLGGGTRALSSTTVQFFNSQVTTYYLGLINYDRNCLDDVYEECDGPVANVSYAGAFFQTNSLPSVGRSAVQASADEGSLLTIYAIFSVYAIGLCAWGSIAGKKLWDQDKFHKVYQLVLFSIQCVTCGMVCQLIHRVMDQTGINHVSFGMFNDDPIISVEESLYHAGQDSIFLEMDQMLPPGKGVPWLDQDSRYLFIVGEWVLLLQSMLLSKGWSIVRRKVPPQGRFRLTVGMNIYLFFCILLTSWLFNAFDESTEVWYFGTTGCAIMFVLRLILLLWFIVSVNHTRDKFLRKRRFFNKYLVLMSSYIIGVPTFQLITELAAEEYLRKQLYFGIEGGCMLGIFTAHLAMYNPDTKCNKGFPFHADVKQMDATFSKKKKVISLEGVSSEGQQIEKIITLKRDDFEVINQYSIRIQARAARLQQALASCADEYADLSFVDEDQMTALDLQNDGESLRDDLTHGLFRTHKFAEFGSSSSSTGPAEAKSNDNLDTEEWGAVAVKKVEHAPLEDDDGDLLSGQIGRKRANALDTAAPSERSDLRKMKRAAARESSKREKQNTPHQVADVADGGGEDEDNEDETIIRRSGKKKTSSKVRKNAELDPEERSPSRRKSKKASKKKKKKKRKPRIVEEDDD